MSDPEALFGQSFQIVCYPCDAESLCLWYGRDHGRQPSVDVLWVSLEQEHLQSSQAVPIRREKRRERMVGPEVAQKRWQ